MKVLIVYDSFFGNTESVARVVGTALGSPPDVQVRKVDQVQPAQLVGLDWLILCSPTRGFRSSDATTKFLSSIGPGGLAGVKATTFDTRIPESKMPGFLRLIVKVTGYAAEKMASALAGKGAEIVGQPGWFFVADFKGPLLEGEMARVVEWANGVPVE